MRAFTKFTIIFVAIGFLSFSTSAETILKFSDYAVVPIKFKQAQSVDLNSHEKARAYRTKLREGFKKPANFAQKYVVVTFGCGSSCQVNWIINKESGRVLGMVGTTYGAAYKKDSRLIMADPIPSYQADFSDKKNSQYMESYKATVDGPRYYVLENDELKLILDNGKQTEKNNR
jgi:hypothetical protein